MDLVDRVTVILDSGLSSCREIRYSRWLEEELGPFLTVPLMPIFPAEASDHNGKQSRRVPGYTSRSYASFLYLYFSRRLRKNNCSSLFSSSYSLCVRSNINLLTAYSKTFTSRSRVKVYITWSVHCVWMK